jgi:hypothetical protein
MMQAAHILTNMAQSDGLNKEGRVDDAFLLMAGI